MVPSGARLYRACFHVFMPILAVASSMITSERVLRKWWFLFSCRNCGFEGGMWRFLTDLCYPWLKQPVHFSHHAFNNGLSSSHIWQHGKMWWGMGLWWFLFFSFSEIIRLLFNFWHPSSFPGSNADHRRIRKAKYTLVLGWI